MTDDLGIADPYVRAAARAICATRWPKTDFELLPVTSRKAYADQARAGIAAWLETMGLRVDAASSAETIQTLFREIGVTLPLQADETDPGTVADTNGQPVAVVDVNREWDDRRALVTAMWIVLCVNTCGGFRLEIGDV